MPLTDLTNKIAFKWAGEAQQAFDKLKEVTSTCSILALPHFTQHFVLECDASSKGIGMVLVQNRHPIAYESWKLKDAESLYSIYKKEMLTIMHALVKFK